MIGWLNKQSYFVVALLVTVCFGLSLFIGAMIIGGSLQDAATFAFGLSVISGIGFSVFRYMTPDFPERNL